jgi:superfamily II DNA helicase RecQ
LYLPFEGARDAAPQKGEYKFCGRVSNHRGSASKNFKKYRIKNMQIKLFTIPILGGEVLTEELNVFLRSKKILQTESHLTQEGNNTFWCFCIKYVEDVSIQDKFPAPKVDYKQVLDAVTFERFSKMREIRKKVSQEDVVPAYAVFTDEELAGLAKIETLTLANMKTVQGIGQKKVEKYGKFFLPEDEKSK